MALRNRHQAATALVERERCRRDAHHFLFGGHLYTKDEHDRLDPVKPFPDRPHLRCLLDCLLISGRILKPEESQYAAQLHDEVFLKALWHTAFCFVEKSRQMQASWLVCAYALWRAKFCDHQLVIIQSKREDDAANLVFNKEAFVARISFMEVHLPEWLRTLRLPKDGSYGVLTFPNGSRIWGIPEGGDIIRSNAPSLVVSDEAAFQPEFGKSFEAAGPCIKNGGQFVAISSAEPGTFAEMVEVEDVLVGVA